MSGGTITIVGDGQVRARLQRLAAWFPAEAGAALYQVALLREGVSKDRTPVDTGALRASHEVELPKREGYQVSVRIVVGGPAAPYAIPVHEKLDVHHPVGQAEFLRSAILEGIPTFAPEVAERIRLLRGI